jgi:hypothetical protein
LRRLLASAPPHPSPSLTHLAARPTTRARNPRAQASIADLARFSKLVKLKAFQPFHSAENALQNINDISEGILNGDLCVGDGALAPPAPRASERALHGWPQPRPGSAHCCASQRPPAAPPRARYATILQARVPRGQRGGHQARQVAQGRRR